MPDEFSNSANSSPKRGNIYVFFLSCLLLLLAIPFGAGVIAGAMEAGDFGLGTVIALGLAFLIIAFSVWLFMRNLPMLALPEGPRMRKLRVAFYGALALAIALGLAIGLLTDKTGVSGMDLLGASTPIPTALAVLLIFCLVLCIILSIHWHFLLDEHVRAVYDFGAVAGMYVYFTVSLVWWLAWRGQIVAEPNGYITFFVVMAVWMLAWLWRRNR